LLLQRYAFLLLFRGLKKKEEKRQEKTLKLYSEFSQSSFFSRTVIFHSLFHRCVKWQISPVLASLVSLPPPPSRYIFLLSSNFVRRMYHPTENSYRYTRGRDRNILVYKRVVVSLFFFLFVLLRLSIHMAYIFVCLFARLYLSDAVFAIISSGF
jgi:hypothetical protein